MSNDSRLRAFADSAVVAGSGWALHAAMRALAAPVALNAMMTFVVLLLCTWLLRRRGESWAAVGFKRPTRYGHTVAWGLGLFAVQMLAPALLTGPIANLFGLAPQNLAAFANLKGNTALYLMMLLPVGWGAAAFGEEMIDRGFIMNRLMYAFGGNRLGLTCALVCQAVLFALAHHYLGPRGMLNAGVLGLLSGAAYFANGRDLWPLIIAHGLVDTMGLTVLFLGLSHG